MPERQGPHIEAFIRDDERFEHHVDAQGNDRWWHPVMPAAERVDDLYDSWMTTAEALKLRHALEDEGGTDADR